MPSNKNREKARQEAIKKQQFELTGKNEMIYKTVALCPVLENNEIIYKVMELSFTLDKKLVSMVEVDKCRTQGSALLKVETAFVNGTCNITQLRKVVRELKKEPINE
jgi:hypothetical protein